MNKKFSLFKVYILSSIIVLVTYLWRFKRLPPQIPLYYSRPAGEENLANNYMIFIIPFLATLFIIINSFISKKKYAENELLQNVIYTVNLCLIIVSSLIFIRIIFLMT